MKKKLLGLIFVMMFIVSMIACGIAQDDTPEGVVWMEEFQTYLGEPIILTTENWKEYIDIYVDKNYLENSNGNPQATIWFDIKDGYFGLGNADAYYSNIDACFEDNMISINNKFATSGCSVRDYSNIVCTEITGVIYPMNVPEDKWLDGQLTVWLEDGMILLDKGRTEHGMEYILVSELPPVYGYMTEEELESYIVETVELSAENVAEYVEIIEVEMESVDAFGDVTGTYTKPYLQLKEGYYVYSEEMIIRSTNANGWDNDTTLYKYMRKVDFYGDYQNTEFTRVQGTIVKIEVPEEEWIPLNTDYNWNMYYEDGDDYVCVFGEDINYMVFR